MRNRRRLTARQRRRRAKAIKEVAMGIVAGLVMGGLFIAAFAFDDYEPPAAPEHYGQIEYGGTWWSVDEYEAMMAERQEYLDAEKAESEALQISIEEAQAEYEARQAAAFQTVTYEEKGVVPYETMSKDWDADEAYMLAKIAMAEAEGEDTEGKALVIMVVLNRVWNDNFPDNIEGVITEEGQFTAYENGRYDEVEPSNDCYEALEMVETGWDESQGATYFEAESSNSTWHTRNLEKLFQHGNHIFYKEKG